MSLTTALLLLALNRPGVGAEFRRETAPAGDLPVVAAKKWALCVGAGAYTDLAPLKFSPNDARAFAGVLRDGYGFDPSTVGLIADGADGGAKPPTSANILGELDRLLADRRLDRGDLFVFYFSGHGIGRPSGDYLMPTDVPEREAETRAIPVKAVIERFVKSGLKNVLVVADACRSGAQNPFGRELQELGKKANIAVLLGCAPGQRSYEYPRLEKGVFTHFLIRAMADRSLADGTSGALWASAIAKKVAGQVKEYTEADYGDDAQIPAVWSEPSQDVLLAAYPPAGEAAKGAMAVFGLEFQAGKVDSERYGRYLAAMGRTFSERGRRAEAIDALKTLDGLGLASWRDLATLAGALKAEDRDNEIGTLVARAVRDPEPDDMKEYVILQGQAAYVGAERYRKALGIVTNPEIYGFSGAQLLTVASRGRLRASDARIAKDLAPYLPLFAKDSMEGRYLAANVALGERRYAGAIALAEAAAAMPGGSDRRAELRQVRYRAIEALNDETKIDAVVAEGMADSDDPYPWATERFKRMEARKDPGLVAAVRTFAEKTDLDMRLTECLLALGPDAGILLPDAERLAAAHPYSWQAPVNVWLAEAAKGGFERVDALPANAAKYAPDAADLTRWALNRYDDLLEDAVAAKRVDGWTAASARAKLAGRYADAWETIGTSPVALMGFSRMLMRSAQATRGAFFARHYLWEFAQKQEYVGAELRAGCLFLALNGADEELAREIFARLERDGELAPRAIVRYAVHQALIGDEKEADRAIALWPKLGRGEPDAAANAYLDGARALMAARRGDRTKAQALVDRVKSTDQAGAILAYVAQLEIAERKKLNADLIPLVTAPMTDWTDVRLHALQTLAALYVGDETPAAKANLASISGLVADYPGHPWTRAFAPHGKTGIAHYAGRSWWKGTFSDGVFRVDASVAFDAAKDGKLLGALVIPGDDLTLSLKGEVDARGNVVAAVIDPEGKEIALFTMKLVPTGTERRDAEHASSLKALFLNSAWNGAEFTLSCTKSRTLAEIAAETKPKTPARPAPKSMPAKRPGAKGGKGGRGENAGKER